MTEGNTLVNAILGAVVSVVLSFLPLSPLLGGLLAGYLEGGRREDGLRVGAIAGLIALLPFAAFVVFLGGLFGALLIGIPMRLGAIGAVFGGFLLLAAAVYTIGLSALGGWLGNYLLTETDLGA